VAEGLTHAIGDALLALLAFAWPDIRPKVERVAARVAEALRPEPPLVLHTTNGELVTGFVVLDRGRALLFFGIRQAPSSPAPEPRYRPVDPHYEARSTYREPAYDADQSLWSPRPYTR
jgi:hypothetical protein